MGISKMRRAGRKAILLFVLVGMSAGYLAISSVGADGIPPLPAGTLAPVVLAFDPSAQPQDNNPKMKELLEERLATAREYAKLVTQRVKNGEGMPDELMEATRMAFEAELDLCTSNKERITVLVKFLVEAKENERILVKFSNRGQIRQSAALKAKAERLQVEITLERAKGKAAPKSAQGDSSQQSIRDEVAIAENQVAIKKAALSVAEAQKMRVMAKLATSKALVAQSRALERFEQIKVKRFEDLLNAKTVEERIVDEARVQLEAAKARRLADEGNVPEWQSQVAVEQARVELARQELAGAELRVKLLKAHMAPIK